MTNVGLLPGSVQGLADSTSSFAGGHGILHNTLLARQVQYLNNECLFYFENSMSKKKSITDYYFLNSLFSFPKKYLKNLKENFNIFENNINY